MGPRNGKERQALQAGMLNSPEFSGGQNPWRSAGIIGQLTAAAMGRHLTPALSNQGVPR
jgi:hypothetical protein